MLAISFMSLLDKFAMHPWYEIAVYQL